MRQSIKSPYALFQALAVVILFSLNNDAYAEKSGSVLVTIKPLYSLVAHLMDGIETPVLLMKQAQSPHHYNMRPSERRLLAQARIIVWIGPQMESHLSKLVPQQDAVVVSAMQASGLRLLEQRNKHSHAHSAEHHHAPGHSHDHNTDHSEASLKSTTKLNNYDPHIWLSAHNAIAISQHISQQLIENDLGNKQRYQDNLQQLIKKTSELSVAIKSQLQHSNQPFITYHDAFQYFEDEHQLRYIDSINFDEETGNSLRHVRKIKKQIEDLAITCLLYQPPKPDMVNTLSSKTNIQAFTLDPLGLNTKNDKDAWFEIMEDMAKNFKNCLH